MSVQAALSKHENVCVLKRTLNNAELEKQKAVIEMKQVRAQLAKSEKR